jgi:hypothetical protein
MSKLARVLVVTIAVLAGGASAAAAADDPDWPWRYDHWPQQQPWQEDAPAAALRFGADAPQPIDPQNWVNPDNMTWLDYRKPPGTSWADPNVSGSARTFKGALVLLDYPNQPFVVTQPQGSGIWEMLSRGSFNGPGGPHSRWMIPPTGGASMGAQHMLRNKIKLQMVDEANVLRLSRAALAESGLVVAKVTARSVQPGASGLSGVNVVPEGGDLSPACNVNTDPLCDGGRYENYTLEVVDRMGSDSFTPDHGVLLAKTKNQDRAPFEWVIDANPQDIGMTDYVLPDGNAVPITVGDYRQLSDALFHAGADSGSEFEYVDEANRLHFYVLDMERTRSGVLSYEVAVRSLDGSGPARRGVRVLPAAGLPAGGGWARCRFLVRNSGDGSDVLRLSAAARTAGWSVWVPNELAAAPAGRGAPAVVFAKRESGSRLGQIRLTATSESDATKSDTGTCVALSR